MTQSSNGDEFTRLSGSLRAVCSVLDADLPRQWVEGSQAHTETRQEPLTGLARRPTADAILHAQLLLTAANDHVRALAALIDEDSVVYSIGTVARGSLEALAQSAYLSDNEIDARERVRRHTNVRLIDLHEQKWTLDGIGDRDQETREAQDHVVAKTGAIIREAKRLHFKVGDEKQRHRPPHLVPKTPGKGALCAEVIDAAEPGLGETVYRLLCSIAHSQPYGLSQHLITDWVDLDPVDGVVHAKVGIAADQLAVRLSAIPLALNTATERLSSLMGWQSGAIHMVTQIALQTWWRISGADAVHLPKR